MKQSIYFMLIAFVLAGCNQDENKPVKMLNDTYHKIPTGYTASTAKARETRDDRVLTNQKEVELAKLKSEESLQLAKIEAKTKEEMKRIETEALKVKVFAEKEVHLQAQKTQKEIAASKEQTVVQTLEKDLDFNKIMLAAIAALVLIVLLVYYLIQRKNKLIEVKLYEEKLKHEASMQANAQHHEKIGRMLEIIADEEANEHVRHALIGILKGQESDQNLIAYQPEEEAEEVKEEKEE